MTRKRLPFPIEDLEDPLADTTRPLPPLRHGPAKDERQTDLEDAIEKASNYLPPETT